jgi:hypothetical protein
MDPPPVSLLCSLGASAAPNALTNRWLNENEPRRLTFLEKRVFVL